MWKYKYCLQENILHSLLLVDDQIIFVPHIEDMEYMVRKLKGDYEQCGLK